MMYIYGGNTCSVNNECESGYSLYFPCIKTITRGENACFDFYIIDNATREEVDLREVDDISLNLSGRYNCNFGSFSYPENIKTLQFEKNSNLIYNVDFTDIINQVKLYIDIVDEKYNLIESHLFNKNTFLDIAIEGSIGYFLKGYNSILNLKAYDTNTLMFLGWNIEENDGECDLENIYDFLIDKRNIIYNIEDDCIIRVVYQKRREYIINMADDNYNSSFIVEYMGKENFIREKDSIIALEGHDVKITCVPNNIIPYEFVKWDDGYENQQRILHVSGDNLTISLKAYCELNVEKKEQIYVDASNLNNFKKIYPKIIESIFVDSYFINNMYVNNCEVDILNDTPYVKIIEGGNIQLDNISDRGNLKLFVNNTGGYCKLFINNYEIIPSAVEKNNFLFEYEGGILTITGKDSCVFGLDINKEIIYQKGKCNLCLNSDDTLKLHQGELVVDGGIIVNGNPYGVSQVNFAKVSNITPLIIK